MPIRATAAIAQASGWHQAQTTQWWLQAGSAAILLWVTLFVRGWDIQTYGGRTLLEQANRTILVSLYFVGTALGVFSFFMLVGKA
ncbi:hypothetical protein ACQUFY_28130 (plasmid) [Robbsia andropogonis]|uniref:hypothetical protein n=1 Tax=Robbsia andropogonis TaxID=28092 RepID=UPI003D25B93E